MRNPASPSTVDRRGFLKSSAGLGGALFIGMPWAQAQTAVPMLTVGSRMIEVNKKAAKVFSVLGANGKPGVIAREGDRFAGTLMNATDEPLQMHWHGQTKAPADQDRARPDGGALAVSQTDTHDFELTPGTHWMHAHALSEQQLLAAPMVAIEKSSGDVQNVIVMLHDFAFRSPQEILAELGSSTAHTGHRAGGGAVRKALSMTHANDVRYDAYLANDRTFDDPETVSIDKGGRVRLRIINGGTATTFFISAPGLKSRCIAVDGSPCQPVSQPSYPLAAGQRIDLLVQIPQQGGAFPVYARVEAERFVTGIVLATAGASVRKFSAQADKPQGMVTLGLELQLRAVKPLATKRPDKKFMAMLGEGPGYRWTINGQAHGEHQPFDVRQGERVEMTFMNPTTMMHPMHLHGHHFQVVGVGRRRFAGAVRDTVIVPAHTPLTIAFDGNHKGSWFMHCHHLYHMATGMMTEVRIS
jgi:FtsP/CotA-like multicopper oxidase with cupredoxin domain